LFSHDVDGVFHSQHKRAFTLDHVIQITDQIFAGKIDTISKEKTVERFEEGRYLPLWSMR